MANQTHIADAPNSILYRALRSAKADEMLSYNAIDEIRDMAGDNIRAEIATMRAEVNGKFDAQSAKFDAHAAEIRSTRWMMGAVFALMATLTALGVFNTVFRLISGN